VVVVDEMIDLSCLPELPAELAPGESIECTGSYEVGPEDMTGEIINVAVASGNGPDDSVLDDSDTAVVLAVPAIPVPVMAPFGLVLMTLLIGLAGLGRAGRNSLTG